MHIVIEAADRTVLEQAVRGARRVRDWRRYQAVVLLATRQTPSEVATALRASLSSVYNWASAWRRAGLAGLHERPHGGRKRDFDAAGERVAPIADRGEAIGRISRLAACPWGQHLDLARPLTSL